MTKLSPAERTWRFALTAHVSFIARPGSSARSAVRPSPTLSSLIPCEVPGSLCPPYPPPDMQERCSSLTTACTLSAARSRIDIHQLPIIGVWPLRTAGRLRTTGVTSPRCPGPPCREVRSLRAAAARLREAIFLFQERITSAIYPPLIRINTHHRLSDA